MRTVFSERLWPAPWVWVGALLVAATLGVAFVPAVGVEAAVGVAAVAVLGAVLLLRYWSPVVRVVEPEPGGGLWLQAGDARIPAVALGEPDALDADGMRAALGPSLDARSHRCIRGWVASGVRLPVVDERDPVPYWLVSTRRPTELAGTLAGGSATGDPDAGGAGPGRAG